MNSGATLNPMGTPTPAANSSQLDLARKSGAAAPPSSRLGSIDAYRGFVMLLMMAEVLDIDRVARAFPQSAIWQWLGHHSEHVDWTGCSLHDLIQPSFSFLVGVALPYSIASRLNQGQTRMVMTGHAVWRSLVLIFLGIFLRSAGSRSHPNFTFEDTLTQIGLGYTVLFWLGLCSIRIRWTGLAVILFGYWAAWALYPLPGPGFDFNTVGVPANWPYHANGFAAHWDKNHNLGTAFDQWFLNWFPRDNAFVFNRGGYLTLSFIPTLGTMLLGLIAGDWCRSSLSARQKLARFAMAGVAGLAAGWLLDRAGICPVVKRIWTPSWTLFSGGWCFLLLAGFYAAVDVWGWRRAAFPLIVIGMNSIAIYCLTHWSHGFINDSLHTWFGHSWSQVFGAAFEPILNGAGVLLGWWLVLYWMYRRKWFIKI